MSKFEAKVKDILVDLGVEENKITSEANLRDDLDIDSLDEVEMIMEFEKEYHIFINGEEAEKIKTVQDIYNLLESKVTNG